MDFTPLAIEELPQGEAGADWTPEGVLTGETGINAADKALNLQIFREASKTPLLPDAFYGILRSETKSYLIRGLSSAVVDKAQAGYPGVKQFNRALAGSELTLLASIELAANGPGRRLFLVSRMGSDSLLGFERWGEGEFADLDQDGQEELAIIFAGLHLNNPDVAVIRADKSGEWEISPSMLVFQPQRPGNYAALEQSGSQTVILLSNNRTEQEPVHTYTYNQGLLTMKP